MLIALEGLDASGKTTQTKLLVDRLRKEGLTVCTLDFPQYTNNMFGRILQKFLANEFGDSVNTDPKLSALLFAGDRYESKKQLEQWLSEPNSVVVLNRYVGSNEAYNRAKTNSGDESYELMHYINNLEYVALGLPRPDLTLVLGSSSAITHKRLKSDEQDGYESNRSFLDKVADVYQEICDSRDNWEFVPIEADESRESVHKKLWKTIQDHRTSCWTCNYGKCRECGERPDYFKGCLNKDCKESQ